MTTTERKIERLLKKGYAETCIVCGAHHVQADSPLNQPCYTHEEERPNA